MINRDYLTTTIPDSSTTCIQATQKTNNNSITDTNIIEHTDIANRNIEVINSKNNETIELTSDEFIIKLNSGDLPNISIVITGDVIFEDSNIYNLPSNLTIKDCLTIKNCNNITSLPKKLNVRSLEVKKCSNLTTLANDIIIQNTLSIIECPIAELPDNLELQSLIIVDSPIKLNDHITVHKLLSLFMCYTTTHLPKISNTIENIRLTYCGNISLPSLTIKNTLALFECKIRKLPEQMIIGESFLISNCPYITSLPNNIYISNDLVITRCDMLTCLPEFWFSNMPESLPFTNSKHHSLTLINTSIPKVAIIHYYRWLFPKYIKIMEEQDYKMFTLTMNEKFKNLISFWVQTSAKEKSINITNITAAEVKDIVQFLQKLIKTSEFLNKITRNKLTTEVVNILQLISQNDELKEDILAIINDAVSACGDRVLLSMSYITLLPLIKQAENESITDKTGAALKKLAKQKLYADEITQYAIDYAKQKKSTEEVEFILDFKIKLKDKFNLHFTNSLMNHSGISNLKIKDTDKAYKIINARVTEDYFNNYLQDWEPWKKHQRRWLLREYNNLKIQNDNEVNIDNDSCCIITNTNKKEIADPIIYNNAIYSYAAFCKWYINTGTNPMNPKELIDINNIYALDRLSIRFNLPRV